MASPPDEFREIERRLIEQADGYRERHHSAKLSLYSGFFAFDGLTLAAAALLSTTGHTHRVVLLVLALSILSCIILFLMGGPPQHSTWDPKPNAVAEIRGAFGPIATNVPGINVCELLPRTAGHAEHRALVMPAAPPHQNVVLSLR